MTVATRVQYRPPKNLPPDKGKVMILDYGSSQPRRGPSLGCCLRTLWSGDARVEFAQCASWGHAVGMLISIAAVAAILTASDAWLREAVVRGLAPNVNLGTWFFNELVSVRLTGDFATARRIKDLALAPGVHNRLPCACQS